MPSPIVRNRIPLTHTNAVRLRTLARSVRHADALALATWSAVTVGAILIVATAHAQPYNQNELQQIKYYGSDDLGKITSSTRQPPLGPLIGALFQHLFGVGQIRQRLVPVLAGIGTLILLALLLRRLRIGWPGAFGLWLMATAPLMMRFSAYTRPYALPVFLMMLLVFGATCWLEGSGRRYLVPAGIGAALLPTSRVPEAVIYLGTSCAVLVVFTLLGRWSWRRSGPVIGICAGALVLVGYPMYRSLASEASDVYDPSPSGVIHRFGSGVHELFTGFLPLLASWFPWWPLTGLVVVLAVALPGPRRRLMSWWFVWPLLAAPVAFALAYHFVNPVSFQVRPYRARMAYFFVPPYVLMAVVLAQTLDLRNLARMARVGVSLLLVATFIGQLPGSVRMLTENQVADYGQVADVLTHDLPDDAIVVYDTGSPVGRWHQPFSARPRYMGTTPYVAVVRYFRAKTAPHHGPVYILLLDSRCAYSVVCDEPPAQWAHPLHGWHVQKRFGRFTLYAPDTALDGRPGLTRALTELGDAYGPRYGSFETYGAAALWRLRGHPDRAHAVVRRMLSQAPPPLAEKIRQGRH